MVIPALAEDLNRFHPALGEGGCSRVVGAGGAGGGELGGSGGEGGEGRGADPVVAYIYTIQPCG